MADVYKIGVVLSLKNGVSAALRVIQGDLGTFMRSVDKANHKVGNLGKNLIAAGAASAAMGAGMLLGAEKILKAGDKMQQQIARMKAAGVNPAQIPLNQQAAYDASASLFNVTPQHAAETLSVLRGILGSSQEARDALTSVLKADVGLTSAVGGNASSGLMQALKALDVTGSLIKDGRMSVAALQANLPYIEQAMILTHGQLTGSDIKRMIQQAGPAATATSFKKLLSDTTEAVMGLGPAVGRGLFMGYKALYAGQVNALQARTLVGTGMLPAEAVHKVKGSFYRIIDTSKLMDDKYLLQNGMLRWLHDKVIPKLQSEGDKGKIALMQILTRLFPATTSARLMSWVVNNWPQRDRFKGLLDQGVKSGDPYGAAQTTWAGATGNFFKALEGLMTALGQPSVGNAAGYLNQFSDAIHRATDWLSKHPGYAKAILLTLTALGAAFVALGVALAAAGVVALLGVGGTLAALAAGVAVVAAAFAALNWKQVSGWISDALHAVGNGLMWLVAPLGKILNFFSSLPLNLFPKHLRDQGSAVGSQINPWAHPGSSGGASIAKGGLTFPGMGSAISSYFAGNGGHWVDHGGFETWSPGAPPVTSAQSLSQHHPVPVVITNPGDIHNGTAKAINSHINGRQHGPSGFDYSYGAAFPAGSY